MAAALCMTVLSLGAAQPPAGVTTVQLKQRVDAGYAALEKLYHDLHAHPELSFHEEKTARKIAQELRAAGLQVTEKVGGHGVVGVLTNGPGPVVLVRADLDALPVREETGLPFASRELVRDDAGMEVPVMHACGHDIHMSVLIGTARLLGELKEHWRGTIVMIGQPAEERGLGAKAMLDDGLLTRFPKPQQCIALHVSAELAAGSVALLEGPAMANVDSVDIVIRGVGGHGAYPHKTKDPIVVAAQTILALQTIVSRETEPVNPAVVTVGSIHGGTKHNIVPSEVKLQLTVRSFTEAVRLHTLGAIQRIAHGQALAAGIPQALLPVVTVSNEHTPSLNNDPTLTQQLRHVFQAVLGTNYVLLGKPVMGGEDFGRYGQTPDAIPICLYWLGAIDPGRAAKAAADGDALPSLHSPFFAPVARPTIQTGVLTMTAAALHLLKR